jgi:hypothetical protein
MKYYSLHASVHCFCNWNMPSRSNQLFKSTSNYIQIQHASVVAASTVPTKDQAV